MTTIKYHISSINQMDSQTSGGDMFPLRCKHCNKPIKQGISHPESYCDIDGWYPCNPLGVEPKQWHEPSKEHNIKRLLDEIDKIVLE